MNHIQWLSLRPAVSSARTLLNSGSCAATKRVRSYRSSIAQAVAADPDPAFCTILPLSVRCFCAGGGGAAALLESAPRVFLVDAVDPAGIGRPGAGLGGVIDEQQHPAWLHDAGDLVEGGMRIDLRPRALGRHPVQVVSESRWRSSALRRA